MNGLRVEPDPHTCEANALALSRIPNSLTTFYFETGPDKLPRLTLNLWSFCLSYSWDDKPTEAGLATLYLLKEGIKMTSISLFKQASR